ncbi:GNAT family N-acetyltransferase [Acanthopleuribacter pedis]|uniref:GNAT family N-acetyltransferase n=1 Tax=Acanthopleuribacter pedis TaxID=442870 RepID=A0A8J7Q5F8_9BACT|nr:GNAT family N-acetyltransferase [Acanthopleuribacter pedis]MBO1316969.1 GNAT family N-acetyltransferase [Acanthopleuribacter pedis]
MTDQPRIQLRPWQEHDLPLLKEVFISTRWDEFIGAGMPEEQLRPLMDQQFHAQHTHYHKAWPEADYDIILIDGEPAGRLYVDRDRKVELRIIDIALLPAFRGRGIGSRMLRELIAEAHGQGKAVRIHVEHNNPALRLYERLGFKHIDDSGVYYLMEHPAPEPATEGAS